jgi:xanthine dehydrogenase YagR molybdenum-binding subunit
MSPVVGAPLDRVDGRAKVTGQARYAADQPVPNLAHGVLVTSRIASGRITHIDTRAAEAAPGVLAVITHRNAPRFPTPASDKTSWFGQSFVPLQGEAIHHSGQIVAFVVAETLEQAHHAAGLVEIDYQANKPEVSVTGKLGEAFVPQPNRAGRYEYGRGQPDGALAGAPARVRATFTTAMQHHNPMEPSTTTAVWDGERLTLYESTQAIKFTQAQVAVMLRMRMENVRVISPFLGGGFGCKGYVWPHTFLTAAIARDVGRPVKLVLTRAQGYSLHGHRAQTVQDLDLAAASNGRLTGIVHVATHQASPFDDITWEQIDASSTLYQCANVRLTRRLVRLNIGTPTPMRAPFGICVFALEAALDELSYATGIDPIELRLRNYASTDQATGTPWGTGKFLRECYELGASMFGWPDPRPRPGSLRKDGGLIGVGMATAFHAVFRAGAEVSIRITPGGQVLAKSATQDIGTGTYTVMTQVVAEALGMSPAAVRFELGDSNMPAAGPSTGSSTAASVGDAALAAGRNARDQVIAIAVADPRSPLHRAPAEQLAVADGRLFLRHDPRQEETYAQVLGRHGRPVEASGTSEGMAINNSYGAVFAEVRVDETTGETRVTRLAGAFDVGRVLNAKTARSQATGGMIWGLGTALTEHTLIDQSLGRILTANLSSYLVPVQADVPDIEVAFVDKADPIASSIGARGMGELSANGATAAIANAIYHATAKRIRDLPITPDKLL